MVRARYNLATIGVSLLAIAGMVVFMRSEEAQAPSIENTNTALYTDVRTTSVLLFAVTKENETNVWEYDPLLDELQIAYRQTPDRYYGFPLFEKYTKDRFLGYRLSQMNDEVYSVNLQGQKELLPFAVSYNSFLLSPQGTYAAFNRLDEHTGKLQFVIRTMATGDERSFLNEVPLPSPVAYYMPLRWSADESYLYMRLVADTEGYFSHLSRLDISTLTLTPYAQVDDYGMVLISIDDNEIAYGVDNTQLDFFIEKGPKEIIRFDIGKNEITKLPLTQNEVHTTLTVNPAGTHIPFTDLNADLWMYDIAQQKETQLTHGYIIDDKSVPWDADKFAFTAIDESGGLLRVFYYDIAEQTLKQVLSTPSTGSSVSIIGWFEGKI